jgi:hypothetical protein
MKRYYTRVKTDFDDGQQVTKHPFYAGGIERILKHALPLEFFQGEEEDASSILQKLPLICWTPLREPPFELSFFVLCRFRPNAFRFFYEMVSRWLIPGKRLNALLQFAVDFSMPDLGSQKYIGGEVMVRIESAKEEEILKKNLPIIESEIRVGMESYYQACRILEVKGLTSDEKTALIQENIVSLIKHRPQDFDYDILSEMQHFLVLCKEEFKQTRGFRHMSRIICVHYLFRKALKLSLEVYPERRYINLKLIRAYVENKKRVLGIAIGMSFLKENERFEALHVLSGIQALLPEARKVEGSFFCNQSRSDPTLTIYLEIEKESGEPITLEEERWLKEGLLFELKNRIEQRLNPIFMPQSEEAIMRHILTLSGQLKYVRDLPQVIIDFAQQTVEKLEFLVVVLRVATPKLKSIATDFEIKPTFLEYVPDRIKMLGWLRKKYKKEAAVFRLRIRKNPFLRKDHSVDLNKARQQVAKELQRIIGEFRDYNGGMISKENELFENLRALAGENAFLLENFFYSLNPPVMRSLLPVEPLKKLFNMVLEAELEGLPAEAPYQISMQYDENYMYILVTARDVHFRDPLMPGLKPFSGKIATCFIHQTELPCFGLIFRDPDEEEALRLRLLIEQTMAELYATNLFKIN